MNVALVSLLVDLTANDEHFPSLGIAHPLTTAENANKIRRRGIRISGAGTLGCACAVQLPCWPGFYRVNHRFSGCQMKPVNVAMQRFDQVDDDLLPILSIPGVNHGLSKPPRQGPLSAQTCLLAVITATLPRQPQPGTAHDYPAIVSVV